MKRIYAALCIVCVLGALVCFIGADQLIQNTPGLTLLAAFAVVLGSGDVVPGLVAAVAGLAVLAVAKRLRERRNPARIVMGVMWIAAVVPLGLAGWKIWRVLEVMRLISEKAGGLIFSIRAPGYAELLLIATAALMGAGLAFGALKLMAKEGPAWLSLRRPSRSSKSG